MLVTIIFISIGLLFLWLGYLIWKKQKISLLHDYHYDKVKEEDKPSFCAISGQGVVIIGTGLLLSGIIAGITNSPWSMLPLCICFPLGLAMLIYAGIRYNR